MNKYPKTTELMNRLQYAATIFDCMPTYVDRIDGKKCRTAKELEANRILSCIKQAWDITGKDIISPSEIGQEYLDNCQDLANMPTQIALLGTEANRCNIPENYKEFSDFTHESIKRLDNIDGLSKDVKDDIGIYLNLWAGYCEYWICCIKNIISRLQEYFDNYQKVITEKQTIEDINTINGNIKRKRGRETKPFSYCVCGDDKESTVQLLHNLLKDKKGKNVALVIKVAINLGLITKPTFTQVQTEFGDVGNVSGYNKYVNGNLFNDDEIKGMKNQLTK
jgi:hypothetical protein